MSYFTPQQIAHMKRATEARKVQAERSASWVDAFLDDPCWKELFLSVSTFKGIDFTFDSFEYALKAL